MRAEFKLLRAAAPYMAAQRGRLFVIKTGGELLRPGPAFDNLLEQLALLHSFGIRFVLVHGGAPQIGELCSRLGLPVELAGGRRITSPEVLEAVSMTLPGSLQSRVLAALRRHGLPAVGLSGLSGGMLLAQRRSAAKPSAGNAVSQDYGEVGDITEVDTTLLTTLSDAGYLPLVAPLACSSSGELLNINADTVAAALALALHAQKLIFLMRPPGILADPQNPASLISELDLAQLDDLEAAGKLQAGMLPKAAAARQALEGGVPRIHFVSGILPDALLQELFTNEGSGTMVTRDA